MDLISVIIIALLLINMLLLIVVLAGRRKKGAETQVLDRLIGYEQRLDRSEASLRDEFGRNRDEISKSARDSREELTAVFAQFSAMLDGKLRGIADSVADSARVNREELSASLKSFEEHFSDNVRQFNDLQKERFADLSVKQDALARNTRESFDRIHDSVHQRLLDIQTDNSVKLEKMRETVDEKLHQTLEARLGESFKLVGDRLELVQKGLGEMQMLASGVGDLKKVLTNVKTKGVLGEFQLESILEQLLTVDQYAKNVKTKEGSSDMVEFAVRIPSKTDSSRIVWLPVDAKFPTEAYERLNAAYDAGNADEIERYKKELARAIKTFAKDIKTKYVDPPNTTDFALMFLPFEGLYAEVLRIPGLFQSVLEEFKVTITGPTTVSAFLSSLQMGFRSLAVEKRTSEIWDLLGAVRTEFGKFGAVLQKTKEKIDAVGKEIENVGVRTRAMDRKLRSVQTLPEEGAQKLLGTVVDEAGANELF
jgi:DNA recombination protein RmuC